MTYRYTMPLTPTTSRTRPGSISWTAIGALPQLSPFPADSKWIETNSISGVSIDSGPLDAYQWRKTDGTPPNIPVASTLVDWYVDIIAAQTPDPTYFASGDCYLTSLDLSKFQQISGSNPAQTGVWTQQRVHTGGATPPTGYTWATWLADLNADQWACSVIGLIRAAGGGAMQYKVNSWQLTVVFDGPDVQAPNGTLWEF
jgi:hypothetical protein